MVRFLLTADVQLGMRATDVPEVAAEVRKARFEALRRVVALAKEDAVDFVVIAGDLFQDNQVSAETAYQATAILAEAAPIPVYVLPGNHDPLSTDSVYRRAAFTDRRPSNVTVLESDETVAIPESQCTLYPCPVRERRSSFDPTAGLAERRRAEGQAISIGVAHGSLAIEGRHSPDDHPIAVNVAERLGLDCLALGHWHSHFVHGTHTLYPGTPEPTAFDERDSGSVCLVSIEGPGAAPRIERRSVGRLQWLLWEVELPTHSLEELRQRVESLESRDGTLLRIVLSGAVDAADLLALDDLEAWLRAQGVLYVDLRREVAPTHVLMSALGRLAEEDPVLAGAVADLERLASLDAPGDASELAAEPRPVEELLSLWTEARGAETVDRAAAAAEAVARLAQFSQEMLR